MAFLRIAPALAFAILAAADEYTGVGNVYLGLSSKSSVNYGDVNPVDVTNSLSAHCDGTLCESGAWTFPTNFYFPDLAVHVQGGTVTVQAVDSFLRGWDKNALVDALSQLAGSEGIFKKDTFTIDVCSDPTDGASCTQEPLDQYLSSSTFDVQIRDQTDGPVVSHIRIGVSSERNDDDFSQAMCGVLAGVGGALAGSFSAGALGAAGFALASLACSAV